MMLDTWDGQIWYPRFYDMDTICSYNNSGEIKFDVDIEMEQGYWNTSSSRLWTKVRDLMHDELVETYKDMRQNGMTFDSFMECFYGDQISKIPQKYYNKDYDVKYAPYSDQYIGKAHGDGYQHLKRWLKNRLIFTDTLFDYAPSYENDVLTIRANTLDKIDITIETYTPVYQHLSWYNGQMSKEKIVPGQSFTFSGNVQASTDQEILIYGGSNIKKITGISSANPNELIIGNAPRLTELVATNCPLLTTINSNKANLSAHTYLNKLDLSGCSQLGGILQLHNSQLIQDINMKGTAITGLQMPKSLRNLKVLRLPNTITELVLNDVPLLNTLEFDEGANLQSINLLNCNKLDNCINFDLTKVPTISLDNSYNAEELYMSATTNLTLKNMPSLKRVIFTPNSEYSAFDINNVLNGANYKITTFNNPMMTDFITTAPHRDSYNGSDVEYVVGGVEYDIETEYLVENYNPNLSGFEHTIESFDFEQQTIRAKVNLSTVTSTTSAVNILSIGQNITTWNTSTACHIYFITTQNNVRVETNGKTIITLPNITKTSKLDIEMNKSGLYVNGVLCIGDTEVLNMNSLSIGSVEGNSNTRSDATYTYIAIDTVLGTKSDILITKDYGDITPNTAFTANTLDLADTQFTNIKFLCTTDVYNLKVPTTMKNFYCDSAFDIDTDVIEEASYEIIHEELIEPYTTNYEGEVTRSFTGYNENVIITDFPDAVYFHPSLGTASASTTHKATDYIEIVGGTYYTVDSNVVQVVEFSDIGVPCYVRPTSNTAQSRTKYIKIQVLTETTSVTVSYTGVNNYTPNIIPSSANGSLIFNMYSNNTTQPTSTSPYMWDLTGLKLEDFYTYGMNNWVKPGDDSYVNVNNTSMYKILGWRYSGNAIFDGWGSDTTNHISVSPILLDDDVTSVIVTTSNGCAFYNYGSSDWNGTSATTQGFPGGSTQSGATTSIAPQYRLRMYTFLSTAIEWFDVKMVGTTTRTVRYYMADMIEMKASQIDDRRKIINGISYDNVLSEIKSITMPQRMPGYSVRLVNADITPDEYPTMLYPKLIDTTLPITGKLDYTKYNGTSLAWAYAYTTGDVSINPLGSQEQGNITQDYNKLYGTDYVDIVDVWVYKDTDTSKLSTNEAITKAYIELTSANYKTRIDEVLQWYPNCTDLYLFDDGSVTSLYAMFEGNNGIYKAQIEKIAFIEGYFNNLKSFVNMFSGLNTTNGVDYDLRGLANVSKNTTSLSGMFQYSKVNSINFDGWDGSNIKDISKMFQYVIMSIVDLSALDLSNVENMAEAFRYTNNSIQKIKINSDFSKVTDLNDCFHNCYALNQEFDFSKSTSLINTALQNTFYNCSSLTYAPILPSNYTGSMQSCFQNCKALTEAPIIPDGVTNMQDTFKGCTSITDWSNMLDFQFDNVTNLTSAFSNTQVSTSIFENKTMITSRVNIRYLFQYYQGTEFIAPENFTFGSTQNNEVEFHSVWGEGNASTIDLSNLKFVENTVVNFYNAFFGGYSGNDKLQRIIFPECNLKGANMAFQGNRALTYIDMSKADASTCTDWGNPFNQYNTALTTFKPPKNISTNLDLSPCTALEEEWVHAVVDNLAEVESATLTLNETLGAYLTPDEVFSANAKGWTIVGASSDFTIINADTDISTLTTDESVLSCFIELTNDNYKTRIDEVLQWYPNCTDLYFFDDGSVTTLEQMFRDNNNNTHGTKVQIQHITFIDGYFKNPTNLYYAFSLGNLLTLNNLPNSITGMYMMCLNASKLTTISNIPPKVNDFGFAFSGCTSLTGILDLSGVNITNPNALTATFQKCSSLTIPPILPSNYTGSMQQCFQGCSSLTQAPIIPNGVNNMQNCFQGCTKLTTVPNIPSSCTNFGSTFQNCSSLTTVPSDGYKGNMSTTFELCTSLNCQINISDANSLQYTFQGCSALTIAPTLPATANCSMQQCFRNCTSLTTPPTIPQGVTSMQSCFEGCSSLTTAPVIPSSVNQANYCFDKCTSLTIGSNIQSTSLKMTCFYQSCSNLQTATIPLNAITEYQDMLNGCYKLTDITWIGERTTNFNFSYIGKNDISQADIKELVPEHLADLTASGTTATLTLGEYASYLSIGEILLAQAKGWTIEGNFSMDYAIVNASTDLSAVEVNSDITTVIVELTNDNYKTRISEVYTKYPSMTDILFIEDGTVTTLADMFNNSNNSTGKSKIKKIEFMDGYFQNLTSLNYAFYNCTSLTDISNIPSSVTNMYRTFYYCYDLENVSDLPDGVTNVNYTFYRCESLVTAPKLGKSTTVLDYTFYGCEYLETVPEFPPNITKLTGTFSGCSKLTSVPDIPNSVTDMSNAFYNCSRLVVAPKLPTGVQTLSSTFYGCSSLQTPPSIIPKSVVNSSSCFNGCTSLVTPPEFEHVDGSNLYPGRMYQNCSKMTTAPKIPNGVDNILGMFVGCKALTIPPIIPDSVTNMQETFNNCTGLTQNPNVPTGVTNLKYAFSNSSITAITIPLTNLTTYDYAISKCPNLTDVTWVGELTSTFNVKNLYYRSATDNTTPTATDIQELVPEHLGDLYKDKAIFDFSKKEITINNTKTTLE